MRTLISAISKLAAAAALTVGLAFGALAQDFPTKPIRFLVGFSAGDGLDLSARIIAEKLSTVIGQPVLVEDLRTEDRFAPPTLLFEHQVISGISVVIQGVKGPYGVLGDHTTQPRRFYRDDVHYMK